MEIGDLVRIGPYTPTAFVLVKAHIDGTYLLKNPAGQVFTHYGQIYPERRKTPRNPT